MNQEASSLASAVPAEEATRPARGAFNLDRYLVPALLAVQLVVFGVLADNFYSVRNLLNVLEQVSVLGIISAGMTLVIICGGFDLSVGSTLALAGCVASLVMTASNVALGVLAGLTVGLAIGLVNGVVISRVRVSPFIATLGMLVVARGLALGLTGGTAVFGLPTSFGFIGSGRLLGVPVSFLLAALVYAILLVVIRTTPFGLSIYAVGGNEEASRLSGIGIHRIKVATYAICGFLAGLAGVVLAARLRAAEPTAGATMELFSIAAVVLGGASLQGGEGFLTRTVLGVLFIGVLQNGLNLLNVPYYWQQVVIGVVFIGAAVLVMTRRSRQG